MNKRQASNRIVAASQALQAAMAAAEHVDPAAAGVIRQADYEVAAATGRCVSILEGRVPAAAAPAQYGDRPLTVGERYSLWLGAVTFVGRLAAETETDWLLEDVGRYRDGEIEELDTSRLVVSRNAVQAFMPMEGLAQVDAEELEDATDSEVREVMGDLMRGAGGHDGATASERFEVAKRRVTARHRRMAVVAERRDWKGFAAWFGIEQ